MIYLVVAAVAFVVCLVTEYLGFERLLATALRVPDESARRQALRRWAIFAVSFWGVALAAAAIYTVLAARSQPHTLAWLAPPLAVLVGTALPMQLAASRLIRAGLR